MHINASLCSDLNITTHGVASKFALVMGGVKYTSGEDAPEGSIVRAREL